MTKYRLSLESPSLSLTEILLRRLLSQCGISNFGPTGSSLIPVLKVVVQSPCSVNLVDTNSLCTLILQRVYRFLRSIQMLETDPEEPSGYD